MDNLEKMYDRRFGEDIEFRKKMYKVLCSRFFQKYIPEDSTVLDIAAGYCEFTNNINAKRKIALDRNSDVKKFAGSGVETIVADSTDMRQVADGTVDVAFASNFFEHLNREDIVKTICEIRRVLRKGGKLLVLQPNIRYCYKDYWMFFDHITPLDDRSMSEALEINGFKIKECIPRFLPYTTKGRLPKSVFLLKLYLMLPFARMIIGRQAFIYAEKI